MSKKTNGVQITEAQETLIQRIAPAWLANDTKKASLAAEKKTWKNQLEEAGVDPRQFERAIKDSRKNRQQLSMFNMGVDAITRILDRLDMPTGDTVEDTLRDHDRDGADATAESLAKGQEEPAAGEEGASVYQNHPAFAAGVKARKGYLMRADNPNKPDTLPWSAWDAGWAHQNAIEGGTEEGQELAQDRADNETRAAKADAETKAAKGGKKAKKTNGAAEPSAGFVDKTPRMSAEDAREVL